MMRGATKLIGNGFLRNRRGATAVEFGIVAPVFLLIVFGIIEFGRAMMAWNEASQALSRAVRTVYIDPSESPDEVAARLRTYLSDDGVLSVTAASTIISEVNYMKISAGFPFQMIIPFSGTSAVTMKVETVAPLASPTK